MDLWKILSILFLCLFLFSLHLNLSKTGLFFSKETVAEKVVKYINDNLAKGVELVSVEEDHGLLRITIKYQGRNLEVFSTLDGKLLFVNRPLDTSKPLRKEQSYSFDAPDRKKPNVKFFVMSFCPFGNQAEEALAPVYELLKDKVEWEPHYVIYTSDMYRGRESSYCMDKYCSMHGIQELHQDVRELCVWKYFDHDLWWKFVKKINKKCNSRNVDDCWKSVAIDVGLDVKKIEDCERNEGLQILEQELNLNRRYGVRGSPTVFINDVLYRGPRTPEAYKQAICSGFSDVPEECSTKLKEGNSPSGTC